MTTETSINEKAAFADWYQTQLSRYEDRAVQLESFVRDQLTDKAYDLHIVSARAKSADSLRQKLLRKDYTDPQRQMTDLVGVRVITYYAEQVDAIATRLREGMTVDEGNSLDKRQELIDRFRFGYRSVHIVGKLNTRHKRDRQYTDLHDQAFEVQVRSVLDHAWAEVEHELVYKSGATFPIEYQRRFAAVAGAFEILEREFLSLKASSDNLVDDYCDDYRGNRRKGAAFDGALLSAALEVQRPFGRSWRQASRSGSSFPPITTVLAALEAVAICNWSGLASALRRQGIRAKLEDYASLAQVAPEEISHLALCGVVIGSKSLGVLKLYLPDLLNTQEFAELFGR